MTAQVLLHGMLQRMTGISMSAFRVFFAGDTRLASFVTKYEERLPTILTGIGQDAFWKFCAKREWLQALLPTNGNQRATRWTDFSVHLPNTFREELDDEAFIEAVRLYVWLMHADEFVHFKVTSLIADRKSKAPPSSGSPKPRSSGSRSSWSSKHRGEDRSLDMYLEEIGETALLTQPQEVSLAERIKQGDQDALQKLTKANLRFVVSVAKQYQNQGLSLGDLIQEGNIGCIKAAKRFDETRGFKFISYAVWWIRQAILQALAEQSRVVRVPVNQVGVLHKIGKVASWLEQDLGRKPTDDEIAAFMADTTVGEVEFVKRIGGTHLSLDAPFSTAEDSTLLDVLEDELAPPPDSSLFKDELRLLVERAIETLTPREAEVIDLYFGLSTRKGIPLEEIGTCFNLTRERVRQIKEKAIRRLRHVSRSKSLVPYKDED